MAFIFNSLGAGEILVILAAALIFFGAERLPEAARTLGRFFEKMRRAAGDFSSSITENDLTAPTGKDSSTTVLAGNEKEQREG